MPLYLPVQPAPLSWIFCDLANAKLAKIQRYALAYLLQPVPDPGQQRQVEISRREVSQIGQQVLMRADRGINAAGGAMIAHDDVVPARVERVPLETLDAVVTRLDERQGPFRRVRTSDGKTGWLHMFDLQSGAQATPAAAPSTGTSALRSLGQAFGAGGTRPTTVATSTVGIRGLDADDLANATPTLAAVDAAGQHKVSESQARQFAQRGRGWRVAAARHQRMKAGEQGLDLSFGLAFHQSFCLREKIGQKFLMMIALRIMTDGRRNEI